jgi:hypothetical protein
MEPVGVVARDAGYDAPLVVGSHGALLDDNV